MPLLHELLTAGNDEDLAELWCAARDGDGDSIEALILGGVDVNGEVFDESGWREAPIHAAAYHGNLEFLQYLLEEKRAEGAVRMHSWGMRHLLPVEPND